MDRAADSVGSVGANGEAFDGYCVESCRSSDRCHHSGGVRTDGRRPGGGGGWTGCTGSACPKGTALYCQRVYVDIGGTLTSYKCPKSDTSPTYESLGDPPGYCAYWYSEECVRFTNAEIGLEAWWVLSCLSGGAPIGVKIGLANGTACDLMRHYMASSGKDVSIDVNYLLATGEFRDAVSSSLSAIERKAISNCLKPPCRYTFDTGWEAMSFDKEVSGDLFYGYRGMTYQVTGVMLVDTTQSGALSITSSYTTTAYKSWNFDRDEKLKGVPFAGPADAAGFGLAREFAVVGISDRQLDYHIVVNK